MATTQVILKQKIQNLGAEGDVVKVRAGFARNFLLPQSKAFEATPGNLRRLESLKKVRVEREAKELEEAEKLAGAGGQQARLQLVEGRQEKPDDLVELAQAAGCVRCMSRTRRPQTEGQTAPRLGALQDRQGQRLVAQAGLTQMRAPALVHGGGEPLARDGRQGHVDRFRDLVQVEGKLRPYLRDDPGKIPPIRSR